MQGWRSWFLLADLMGTFEEVLAMDQVKQAEKKIILSGIFSVQALEVRSKVQISSFHLRESTPPWNLTYQMHIYIYIYVYIVCRMLRNYCCISCAADQLLQWIAPHQYVQPLFSCLPRWYPTPEEIFKPSLVRLWPTRLAGKDTKGLRLSHGSDGKWARNRRLKSSQTNGEKNALHNPTSNILKQLSIPGPSSEGTTGESICPGEAAISQVDAWLGHATSFLNCWKKPHCPWPPFRLQYGFNMASILNSLLHRITCSFSLTLCVLCDNSLEVTVCPWMFFT